MALLGSMALQGSVALQIYGSTQIYGSSGIYSPADLWLYWDLQAGGCAGGRAGEIQRSLTAIFVAEACTCYGKREHEQRWKPEPVETTSRIDTQRRRHGFGQYVGPWSQDKRHLVAPWTKNEQTSQNNRCRPSPACAVVSASEACASQVAKAFLRATSRRRSRCEWTRPTTPEPRDSSSN